jgi:hypothetical protein
MDAAKLSMPICNASSLPGVAGLRRLDALMQQ